MNELERLKQTLLTLIEINDKTLEKSDSEFGGDFLRIQSNAFDVVIKMIDNVGGE